MLETIVVILLILWLLKTISCQSREMGSCDECTQNAGNCIDRARSTWFGYGSFTYTKETHEAKLGPIELSVKDKETVNIPIWAGVGAIVARAVLLFVRK